MRQGHHRQRADQQMAVELVELLDQYLWATSDDTKFLCYGDGMAPVTPAPTSISTRVLAAATPDAPASRSFYPDIELDLLLEEDQAEQKHARRLGAKVAHIQKTNKDAWQLAHWGLQSQWQKLPAALQESTTPSFERLELPQALATLRKAQAAASAPARDFLTLTLVTSVESNGLPGDTRMMYLNAHASFSDFGNEVAAKLPLPFLKQGQPGTLPVNTPQYIYQFGHPSGGPGLQQRDLNTEEDLNGLIELLKGRQRSVFIWHEMMWQESLASRARWAEIKEMAVEDDGWEIFEPVFNPAPSSIDFENIDLGVERSSDRESDSMNNGPATPEWKPRPQTRSAAKKAVEAMRSC